MEHVYVYVYVCVYVYIYTYTNYGFMDYIPNTTFILMSKFLSHIYLSFLFEK